jgi:hypothetical protein
VGSLRLVLSDCCMVAHLSWRCYLPLQHPYLPPTGLNGGCVHSPTFLTHLVSLGLHLPLRAIAPMQAARKAFFAVSSEWFRVRLHPKVEWYGEEERREKVVVMVKQAYEGSFHLAATLFNFWMTRNEPWMPTWIGGTASCDSIFAAYPQWPQQEQYFLCFYQFQFGTYLFQIMDLLVFDHERYRTKNFG